MNAYLVKKITYIMANVLVVVLIIIMILKTIIPVCHVMKLANHALQILVKVVLHVQLDLY